MNTINATAYADTYLSGNFNQATTDGSHRAKTKKAPMRFSKKLTQLLFKRTNVAVKIRCSLFAMHLLCFALMLILGVLLVTGINYGVAHWVSTDFELSNGSVFNLSQRRHEIAGVFIMLFSGVLLFVSQTLFNEK